MSGAKKVAVAVASVFVAGAQKLSKIAVQSAKVGQAIGNGVIAVTAAGIKNTLKTASKVYSTVARHVAALPWQNIAAVAVGIAVGVAVTAAIIGAVACTAATLGLCAEVIIGASVVGGAVSGAVTYGLSTGEKTGKGLAEATRVGAASGLIGGVVGGALGKVAVAVAPYVVKAATAVKAAVPVIRTLLSRDAAASGIPVGERAISMASGAGDKLVSKGFADEALLIEHAGRHGPDFGLTTPHSYLEGAETFMNKQPPKTMYWKIRENGDRVRYDIATEEFGVASKQGIIRTYYEPVPLVGHPYETNLEYFYAQ
ncbi:hypothetical protein BH09ACT1_BH09ACT1_26150 [soil metagenome]